jgi:hypothetical protein
MKTKLVLCLATGLALIAPATLGTAGAAASSCFARPSACGYPDASNTGVPAGTALTASGSRTISTNGTVLNALEIKGTVTIAADNVTIQNSRIVESSGGSGSVAVMLDNGADNFTIKNSEVVGPASNSSGLESAVWNHYDNPGASASRVYFHRCADCWEGAGSFHDSYMVVDAAYSGSHDEDIYVCGTSVEVEHSTLINTHEQTATVFGDTICGPNTFIVRNSLLAGGGYVLYPQANSSSKVGTTEVVNNRFGRCLTATVYNSASGGRACAGGPDANGIFPGSGYFGVSAYTYSGSGQTWNNNVWDDSSQPFCAGGGAGCGVVVPPPTSSEPVPPVTTPPSGPPVTPVPPVVTTPPATSKPKPGNGGGNSADPGKGSNAGSGSAAGPADPPAHAAWTTPALVGPGHRIRLDAGASTGALPIACRWTISGADGGKVLERKRGCVVWLRMPEHGGRTVKLTVTGSDAASDSVRHRIRVGTGQPTAALAAAQIAGPVHAG